MKTESLELKKIVENVRSGLWQLPGFQREYVWNPVQISKFVKSIFMNRPVGVITSWAQPDRKLHTEASQFTIGKSPKSFGDASMIKSVDSGVSLIIDGRQRITSLLHVFEDFRPGGSDKLAIKWFVSLDKSVKDDDFIIFEKESALSAKGLDTTANALKNGFFPLSRLVNNNDLDLILDNDIYDPNNIPSKELKSKRKQAGNELYTIFIQFKMPLIEVSKDVGLDDVCDIFDTLNQTGTSLSTFDLIHNKLFPYDLRESYRNNVTQGALSSVFGGLPKEAYAQFVTSLAIVAPITAQKVENIKATSMLNLKVVDFERIDSLQQMKELDVAVNGLWNAFDGSFPGRKVPYPITLSIFCALWLGHENVEARDRLTVAFRAYFVRSAFDRRFTEGQIAKHSADLQWLSQIVRAFPGAALESWTQEVRGDFDHHVKNIARDAVVDLLLDPAPDSGAASKVVDTFLLAQQKKDLLTMANFRDLPSDNQVEIHHFFPKKFLSNSKASFPNAAEQVDCFANRVPLSRISNNEWKAKDPATILTDKKLDWSKREEVFLQAGFSKESFEIFGPVDPVQGIPKKPLTEADIMSVWEQRAAVIADRIFSAAQLKVL